MISLTELYKQFSELEKKLDDLQGRFDQLTGEQGPGYPDQRSVSTILLNKENAFAKLSVLTADFGFSPCFRVESSNQTNITLHSKRTIKLESEHLHVLASNILLEADEIVVGGELAARLKYSKPIVWRKGQERIRLFPAALGYPVITAWEKASSSTTTHIRLSIDKEDRYWYLSGSAGVNLVEAVFVGKF